MGVSEPIFTELGTYTHMPFLEETEMVFCLSDVVKEHTYRTFSARRARGLRDPRRRALLQNALDESPVRYRAWKLHHCNRHDLRPIRIETGLGADAVECSPTFYRADGRVHLSFIGGVPGNRGTSFHLYTMDGPSLQTLSPPQRFRTASTQFGFVGAEWICWTESSGLCLESRISNAKLRLAVPFSRLFRVAFLAKCPQKLLITGADSANRRRTIVYDMEFDESLEVLAEVPVYKCSIFDDLLVVSVPADAGIESYKLHSSSFVLAPSELVVSTKDLSPGNAKNVAMISTDL